MVQAILEKLCERDDRKLYLGSSCEVGISELSIYLLRQSYKQANFSLTGEDTCSHTQLTTYRALAMGRTGGYGDNGISLRAGVGYFGIRAAEKETPLLVMYSSDSCLPPQFDASSGISPELYDTLQDIISNCETLDCVTLTESGMLLAAHIAPFFKVKPNIEDDSQAKIEPRVDSIIRIAPIQRMNNSEKIVNNMLNSIDGVNIPYKNVDRLSLMIKLVSEAYLAAKSETTPF